MVPAPIRIVICGSFGNQVPRYSTVATGDWMVVCSPWLASSSLRRAIGRRTTPPTHLFFWTVRTAWRSSAECRRRNLAGEKKWLNLSHESRGATGHHGPVYCTVQCDTVVQNNQLVGTALSSSIAYRGIFLMPQSSLIRYSRCLSLCCVRSFFFRRRLVSRTAPTPGIKVPRE